MKRVVIGTAGHIDHGKSTLIKTLTGIQTDSTKEEQQRGLTINLGFAHLDLPSGESVGIVDVPGHEKFIKNMVAGAIGIDLVLLVIDAHEGIMAQTREHVAIMTLLGIKNYVIALTKVADVDPELKDLVYLDIHEQFQGTPLENAPIVETDAIAGIGLDKLKQVLDEVSQSVRSEALSLPARMNIDRAFSVKGFGTVVTGTLIEGQIKVGDELFVYPAGIKTKVRSIQIHEEEQPVAEAGNRTALNLTKVTLDDIGRGSVLSQNELEPTYMLDVKLHCLEHAHQPIELWDRVHLHIGTREVLARVVPLGQEIIMPGSDGYAQLRLEEEIAVKRDDHFIIRSYSPVDTIGGGMVLDTHPQKHKRFNEEVIESLEIKEAGDLSDIILDFMNRRTFATISASEIADYLNEEPEQVDEALDKLVAQEQLTLFGHRYISTERIEDLIGTMMQLLKDYHEKYPVRNGMPLEEFRSNYNKLAPRDLSAIMKELETRGLIAIEGEFIRSADFELELDEAQQALKEAMLNELKTAQLQPPTYEELVGKSAERKEMLNSLLDEEIIQLDRITFIHKEVYEQAVEAVVHHIQEHGQITLAEFRDLMDTSRKYSLIFLDYLDEHGITKRIEDYRVLA